MTDEAREEDPLDAESPYGDQDEYGALRVPDLWPTISLLFFVLSLGARYLLRALPDQLLPLEILYGPLRFLLPGLTVLVLATLGLLTGLLGLRSSGARGVARLGVLLNGIVLALSLLAVWAFFTILPDEAVGTWRR